MLHPRRVGDLSVAAIGLGCVGMSAEYGFSADRDDAASLATLERAFDLGVTLYDTADSYGPFTNEELLARFVVDKRDAVVISSKAGLVLDETTGKFAVDGRPEHLKAACTASLRRLGVEAIDLYFLHRTDPLVPLEDSWGALLELRQDGLIKHLGICEVDREQLDTIQPLGRVTAVQSEFSLWTRDAQAEILPWCEANDVGFIPFAPLGRGFLTGTIASAHFDAADIRASNPRFARDAVTANQAIVEAIRTVADRHDATPAQIAIAWVLAQGESIVPIPGTKQARYVEQNVAAAQIALTEADLTELDQLPQAVGSRY